jgi:hypothetical protein
MNKTKIIPIIIAGLLIGLGAASIVNADTLEGKIDVTVSEWGVGVVTPELNLDNESSVEFGVDIEGTGDNTTFTVNDTLIINLDINDITEREEFWLPRSIVYTAVVFRIPFLQTKLLPLIGSLDRFLPIRAFFKSVNVVNSTIGEEKSDNITIPVMYSIDNDTYHSGENLTLHLWIMGFLPGVLNGISEEVPIIGYQKISLDITYVEN